MLLACMPGDADLWRPGHCYKYLHLLSGFPFSIPLLACLGRVSRGEVSNAIPWDGPQLEFFEIGFPPLDLTENILLVLVSWRRSVQIIHVNYVHYLPLRVLSSQVIPGIYFWLLGFPVRRLRVWRVWCQNSFRRPSLFWTSLTPCCWLWLKGLASWRRLDQISSVNCMFSFACFVMSCLVTTSICWDRGWKGCVFGRGLASNCFREPLSSYCLFDKGSEGWVFGVVLKQVLLKSVTPRMSYKHVVTIVSYESYQWFRANVTCKNVWQGWFARASDREYPTKSICLTRVMMSNGYLREVSYKEILSRLSCQECHAKTVRLECYPKSVFPTVSKHQECLMRVAQKNVAARCHAKSLWHEFLRKMFYRNVMAIVFYQQHFPRLSYLDSRLFYKSVRPFYKSVIYNTA